MDKDILKQLNQLSHRVRMLSRIQMLLVEHMNKLSNNFHNDFIASALADSKIREGFTEWLNNDAENVLGNSKQLDEVKVMMMEINEELANRKDK